MSTRHLLMIHYGFNHLYSPTWLARSKPESAWAPACWAWCRKTLVFCTCQLTCYPWLLSISGRNGWKRNWATVYLECILRSPVSNYRFWIKKWHPKQKERLKSPMFMVSIDSPNKWLRVKTLVLFRLPENSFGFMCSSHICYVIGFDTSQEC